jgi:lipopolysaccharide/colanic/teichoic acid biosynthesis glycosyltransferase
MRELPGADEQQLSDAQRLTPLGRRLRAWSLDELPTLWNVLRGEMSLVGPRPLLMRYLPHYSPYQARRHEVRPGITGWAQISGRNSLSWERRFDLDVWYVDNLSLAVDTLIIARTLAKVITRDGIEFPEPDSMPYFAGSSGVLDRESADSVGRDIQSTDKENGR